MSAPRPTGEGEGPLFSPYWYKVRALRPRLRPGVAATRRVEQGVPRHVLAAPESGRHFALGPGAWAVIGALDGTRTVDAAWREADRKSVV